MDKAKNFHKIIVILFLCLYGEAYTAGFHYKIDVATHIIEDSSGKLNGLRMQWLYDSQITKLVIKGKDMSNPQRFAKLNRVADLMMSDLSDFDYFTRLKISGKQLQVATVTDYQLDLLNGQLTLDFMLPLTEPLDLSGKQLSLEMADPAGTATLKFLNSNPIRLGVKTQTACEVTLEERQEYSHGEAPQIGYLQCK